jgi:hypothetical protein
MRLEQQSGQECEPNECDRLKTKEAKPLSLVRREQTQRDNESKEECNQQE